jgi:hypothetical protein
MKLAGPQANSQDVSKTSPSRRRREPRVFTLVVRVFSGFQNYRLWLCSQHDDDSLSFLLPKRARAKAKVHNRSQPGTCVSSELMESLSCRTIERYVDSSVPSLLDTASCFAFKTRHNHTQLIIHDLIIDQSR